MERADIALAEASLAEARANLASSQAALEGQSHISSGHWAQSIQFARSRFSQIAAV